MLLENLGIFLYDFPSVHPWTSRLRPQKYHHISFFKSLLLLLIVVELNVFDSLVARVLQFEFDNFQLWDFLGYLNEPEYDVNVVSENIRRT